MIPILAKLAAVKTMPDLELLRHETVRTLRIEGSKRGLAGYAEVQGAFKAAQARVKGGPP